MKLYVQVRTILFSIESVTVVAVVRVLNCQTVLDCSWLVVVVS